MSIFTKDTLQSGLKPMTYNPDGTVASVTKAGRTTTFAYSGGLLTSTSDGVVDRASGYTGGQLTSVIIN